MRIISIQLVIQTIKLSLTKAKTGNLWPLTRARIARQSETLEHRLSSTVHLSSLHSNVLGSLIARLKIGKAPWMMVVKHCRWLAGQDLSLITSIPQVLVPILKPLRQQLTCVMSSSARNMSTTMLLLPHLILKPLPVLPKLPSDGSHPTLCHLLSTKTMELWLLAPTLLHLL